MPTKPKLTKAQKDVIKRMREGGRLIRSGGINPRVTISAWTVRFPTFSKLEDMGLIEATPRGEKQIYDIYTLTAIGREIEL